VQLVSRSIQQSAAIALGRLANYSDHLAEAVVSNEILPQLVYSLSGGACLPDTAGYATSSNAF